MSILFRNRDQLCHDIHCFKLKCIFFKGKIKFKNKLVKGNVFFYQMIVLPQRLDNKNLEKNAEEKKKGTLK